MKLTQQETTILKDLQAQENLCAEKYRFYAAQAKDSGLKNLFEEIGQAEQQHYETLGGMLNGQLPNINAKSQQAAPSTQPKAVYGTGSRSADKRSDKFLSTDSIATEKFVSSEYDNGLFRFADPEVRTALNHIQTEEQNHAELLHQYQAANSMV